MSCSSQKRRIDNAPTTSGSSRSSIGALSHSLISRSTCQSTMRRITDFRSSSCEIESIRMRLNSSHASPTRTSCRIAYFGDNMNDWLKRGDSPCSDEFAN